MWGFAGSSVLSSINGKFCIMALRVARAGYCPAANTLLKRCLWGHTGGKRRVRSKIARLISDASTAVDDCYNQGGFRGHD